MAPKEPKMAESTNPKNADEKVVSTAQASMHAQPNATVAGTQPSTKTNRASDLEQSTCSLSKQKRGLVPALVHPLSPSEDLTKDDDTDSDTLVTSEDMIDVADSSEQGVNTSMACTHSGASGLSVPNQISSATVDPPSKRKGSHETDTKTENSASSDGPFCSSGKEGYDFVMWFHDKDQRAAKIIYSFLEGDLHLNGFMYSRDKIVGPYELKQKDEAIKLSEKILLFITPRSIHCPKFEDLMCKSMHHSIEVRGNKNVIPIYSEIKKHESPSIVRSIYGLDYQDFSEKFKVQISKIFGPDQSPSSRASLTTPFGEASGTDRSTKPSDFSKLKQSQSLPTPKKGNCFLRWFSSGK